MNYVNFKSIIDDLKKIEFYHKQTNSFGVGDIKQLTYLIQQRDKVENVKDRPPIYPLVYVIPRQVQNYENYVQYSLNVLVCDIMNANNFDIEVDLWSSTLAIAQDILAQYKYSVNAQQGDYENRYDLVLPANLLPFSEAYDDFLVGWNLDLNVLVDMPLNRCLAPFEPWVSPTTCELTPTITPTNTSTPTPTPTPTCAETTQYLEVQLQENTKFKMSLYNDSEFTSPADALCTYTISGVAYGDMGTIFYGTEDILVGQHNKQFDLAPVLQEGEIVQGFAVLSYTTNCVCPLTLVLPQTLWVAAINSTSGNRKLSYSVDGLNWSASTNAGSVFLTSNVYAVEYNGTRWVAGALAGANSLGYSNDGKTWFPSNNGNDVLTETRAIAWNGTRWVAGGEGGSVLVHSLDGSLWSGSTNGTSISISKVLGLASDGSKFIAAGVGANRLVYSNDGITWSASTNGSAIFTTAAYAVAYNGTTWLAGGQGTNTLAYSTDGITWSATTNGNSIFTYNVRDIAWNGNIWVAVGSGTNSIGYSTDGLIWSGASVPAGMSIGIAVAWNGSLWLASNSPNEYLAYSLDGINWQEVSDGPLFASGINDFASKPSPNLYPPIS